MDLTKQRLSAVNIEQSSSILLADNWTDYQLLDGGDGMKQERWGDIVLVRPDPQIIWPRPSRTPWNDFDAIYHRNEQGGGRWEFKRTIPASWTVRYRHLTFKIRPTGFKHLGLFPEQAVNWDWLAEKIRGRKAPVSLLNLFGYTGGVTVAASAVGASVCHVDAAAGMVDWCRENAALNGLAEHPIRYIVDDCLAFVKREIRREKRYDALVMDPPSFGRGRRGEVWKLEDQLWELLSESRKLLSKHPLLFLVNCYTAHVSALVMANMLSDILAGLRGRITSGELGLPFQQSAKILPCGIYCRWEP
ncbi:MAG: class I SAM-dependent methyltransferase [Kiritimatiellae bacterium]|nr:class I SAM-dependent methyltransferase [Kiritimatiellia bacterium]